MCLNIGQDVPSVLIYPETDEAKRIADYFKFCVYVHLFLVALRVISSDYLLSLIDLCVATVGYSTFKRIEGMSMRNAAIYGALVFLILFVWSIVVISVTYSTPGGGSESTLFKFILTNTIIIGSPIIYICCMLLSYKLYKALLTIFDRSGANGVVPSSGNNGPQGVSMNAPSSRTATNNEEATAPPRFAAFKGQGHRLG